MNLVISETRGSVGILTLNNPEHLNALTGKMIPELLAALQTFEADPQIHVIVLTGAGRGFCAGASLAGDGLVNSGGAAADRVRANLNQLILNLRRSRLPVVIAVNGPAAGGGVGIALAGDFVLAASTAKFVLSFVRIGAALDGGASVFLPRLIGPVRARAMAMLGEPVDADTAERWGLIFRVVPDGVLLAEALDLADRLASGPPLALSRIKQELENSWNVGLLEGLETEARLQGEAFLSEDLREGVTAFKQKRAPQFRGR